MTDVKICGITTPEALTVAIENGARFVGFVFVPGSPRVLEPEVAAYLAHFVPKDIYRVGLFADADDAKIQRILGEVPLDILQLHGIESPGRVAEIKHLSGLPVIKALSLQSESDFEKVEGYEAAADWLLFDAATGGSGQAADWDLLHQFFARHPIRKPWMLAGGLQAGNIASALALLDPDALDVSSGVENTRGVKDPEKIRDFLQTAATF